MHAESLNYARILNFNDIFVFQIFYLFTQKSIKDETSFLKELELIKINTYVVP